MRTISNRWLLTGIAAWFLLCGSLAHAQEASPVPGSISTLAFFLDSTDTLEPHAVWISNILTYRQAQDGKEIDLPALAVSYGIHSEIQVSFSIPYFRSKYGSDFRINGIGDKFLSVKFQALNADRRPIGLAFEPVIEILGKGSLAAGELGPGKYNLALPILVQKNFERFSLFGEAGYITRRAAFAGIGFDAAVAPKVGVMLNLLYSKSTSFSELSREFGLLQSRADANVGLYYVFKPNLSLFVSGGRTITELDPVGTRYILNFGLNVGFNLRDMLRLRN
ncbi:MAG: hypothetical protein AB1898_17565 [Acidobacteriota bacterium]